MLSRCFVCFHTSHTHHHTQSHITYNIYIISYASYHTFVPKSTECYRDVNLILCPMLYICATCFGMGESGEGVVITLLVCLLDTPVISHNKVTTYKQPSDTRRPYFELQTILSKWPHLLVINPIFFFFSFFLFSFFNCYCKERCVRTFCASYRPI